MRLFFRRGAGSRLLMTERGLSLFSRRRCGAFCLLFVASTAAVDGASSCFGLWSLLRSSDCCGRNRCRRNRAVSCESLTCFSLTEGGVKLWTSSAKKARNPHDTQIADTRRGEVIQGCRCARPLKARARGACIGAPSGETAAACSRYTSAIEHL